MLLGEILLLSLIPLCLEGMLECWVPFNADERTFNLTLLIVVE